MAQAYERAPRPPVAHTQGLTLARARAIRAAMRSFLDDVVADGERLPTPRWCDRCRAMRPAAGRISYQGTDLCNRCATTYELHRAAGRAHTPAEFLARKHGRRGGPTRAYPATMR
jgi:hypothetical protein